MMTEKKMHNKEWVKSEVISWIKTFAMAFIIAFIFNNYIVVNATVPTGSMETTIMPKDRIMANRWAYFSHLPERGDIIVFPYPDDEKTLYVKRIIGLPGETIEIKNGGVYINGSEESLEEIYLHEKMVGNFGPYKVPEDSYFMLGDNRNNSRDSRYWNHSFVQREKIIGKVFFKYFPKIQWMSHSDLYNQ